MKIKKVGLWNLCVFGENNGGKQILFTESVIAKNKKSAKKTFQDALNKAKVKVFKNTMEVVEIIPPKILLEE